MIDIGRIKLLCGKVVLDLYGNCMNLEASVLTIKKVNKLSNILTGGDTAVENNIFWRILSVKLKFIMCYFCYLK